MQVSESGPVSRAVTHNEAIKGSMQMCSGRPEILEVVYRQKQRDKDGEDNKKGRRWEIRERKRRNQPGPLDAVCTTFPSKSWPLFSLS